MSKRATKELNYLMKMVSTKRISANSHHFACPACGGKLGRSGFAVVLSGGVRLYCNQPSCSLNKSQRRKGTSMVDFVQMVDPSVRGYRDAQEKIQKARVLVEVDLYEKFIDTKPLRLPYGTQLIGHGGGTMAEQARAYLEGRGFSIKELHDHYRIGYTSTQVKTSPDYGWLIIPFYDVNARLVYYQKRSFLQREDGKRWDNPSAEKYGIGKASLIFNEFALYSGEDRMITTEGATDSMTLGPTAGGTLGLTLSDEVAFKLVHRGPKDLIYFLDAGAWVDCLLNAYELVKLGDENIWVVPVEEGEDDPNTMGRERAFEVIDDRKFRLGIHNIFEELERIETINGKTYRSQTNLNWI